MERNGKIKQGNLGLDSSMLRSQQITEQTALMVLGRAR